jgi:hypothetical protein
MIRRGPPVLRDPLRGVLIGLASVAAWALVRYLQLKYAGSGMGYDVGLYQSYARSWASGSAPYVDFHPEYPPGALPIFLAPIFWTADYATGFAMEMAFFDLTACLIVVAWARRLFPDRPSAPAQQLAVYLLMTAALYPVLYTRFDLAPASIALAGLYLLYLNRWRWGLILLGFAGAVKLWPLALIPLALAVMFRRGGWSRLVQASAWASFGVLLPALPLLPRAGWEVLSFLKYHAARGIEIGSTWSTAALTLNLFHIAPAHAEHEFGAFHVKGPAASVFATVSMPLLVLFALAPQVMALRKVGRTGDRAGRVGVAAASASILGFIIAGKVLSPQFALWLAPFLPLAMEGSIAAGLAVLCAVGTTAEYPFLAAPLEMLAPGHAKAVIVVGIRNVLFVVLYFVMCRRIFRDLGKGRVLSPRALAPRGTVL